MSSLATPTHWVWVYSCWILIVKRAPEMASIFDILRLYIYARKYPSDSNQNAKTPGFASPRSSGMALSEFRNNQCTSFSSCKDDIAAFRRYYDRTWNKWTKYCKTTVKSGQSRLSFGFRHSQQRLSSQLVITRAVIRRYQFILKMTLLQRLCLEIFWLGYWKKVNSE